MASLFSPFRQTYRYLVCPTFLMLKYVLKRFYIQQQRQAHESPVIFYSVVLGTIGPVMAVAVPPIREYFGYRPAEMIPTSYPLPNRPRRTVQGYDDE
ncbi:NADH-ubiquinone oxidoreductase 9.5 kDa subunit [Leucoagaricus sp. SymC.cos]|nr:NADH-ubiquinone oxidoreductase 9.5 kDa subunit [Leucoagaricus sp. SymC.cos]